MSDADILSAALGHSIRGREPVLWLNEHWLPQREAMPRLNLGLSDVTEAEWRLRRSSRLLAKLFPELEVTQGIIESPLIPADALRDRRAIHDTSKGRWLIKADNALPVAGSIKARGGIYEVLLHAEDLAVAHGLMRPDDDPIALSLPHVTRYFASRSVVVGSTGNLGLSIGLMAAALGFKAVVHMSSDAKEWKKERLRTRGVEVIEHSGDFGKAVAAGREEARRNPNAYFVDDEDSPRLLLGYSVAALRMKGQLEALGIDVGPDRPMFVYLPCGVGGAPAGITLGLRCLFADHVHCFLAEPTSSPSMLVRLASTLNRPLSVRDVGLDNRTEADGLAVAQASELAASILRPLVSGAFTVPDSHLFEDLYLVERHADLRIEPSAAAGFRGPDWLLASPMGARYLQRQKLESTLEKSSHVLWSTGGAFLPSEEYQSFWTLGQHLVS